MQSHQASTGFALFMAAVGAVLFAGGGLWTAWESRLVARKYGRPRPAAEAVVSIPAVSEARQAGYELYLRHCAGCHGARGDAATMVASTLSPRPRDLTTGIVKFKSTPWDRPPTRGDLITIVSKGVRWSAMPPFEERLSSAEIESIVDFLVETFFMGKSAGPLMAQLHAPDPPPFDDDKVARGETLFGQRCAECHGLGGRRDDPRRLFDVWDQPVFPRDLTLPIYKRGSDPKSLYLRVKLGVTGTPMIDPAHGLTDEDIWSIVAYVRSIQQWPEDFVETGSLLYEAMGCVQCHGESGRGGVMNPNYVKGTPPALDGLAERMFLDFEEDIAIFIGALARDPGSVEKDENVRKIPSSSRVLGKYRAVINAIRNGSPAAKADAGGPEPPLHMPTWYPQINDEEINSILAYLLTLYEEEA